MTDMENLLTETSTAEKPQFATATVAARGDNGVTLKFPGESNAGSKQYRCVVGAPIKVGDRVLLLKDSGTYVVLGALGGAPGRIWNWNKCPADASVATAVKWINSILDALADMGISTLSGK